MHDDGVPVCSYLVIISCLYSCLVGPVRLHPNTAVARAGMQSLSFGGLHT